eukprot:3188979-Rhodomonas_salina.2
MMSRRATFGPCSSPDLALPRLDSEIDERVPGGSSADTACGSQVEDSDGGVLRAPRELARHPHPRPRRLLHLSGPSIAITVTHLVQELVSQPTPRRSSGSRRSRCFRQQHGELGLRRRLGQQTVVFEHCLHHARRHHRPPSSLPRKLAPESITPDVADSCILGVRDMLDHNLNLHQVGESLGSNCGSGPGAIGSRSY